MTCYIKYYYLVPLHPHQSQNIKHTHYREVSSTQNDTEIILPIPPGINPTCPIHYRKLK